MSDSSAIEAITSSKRAPAQPIVAPPPTPVVAVQTSVQPVVAQKSSDQASLSPIAQMTVLKDQGLTVGEIAAIIGLPLSTVQANLGLSSTSSASTIAAF